MTKFLCVTAPVTGHVVPLLPLVRKLVERGHEVRWYTSARFQSKIEATGARFLRFQNVKDVDYHHLNGLFPERAALEGIAQGKWDLKFIIDINVEQCRDLFGMAEAYRPDLIVGDTMAFAAGFPIRRAVATVLADGRYRERAQAMRNELSRYDAATRGADLIETLLVDPAR